MQRPVLADQGDRGIVAGIREIRVNRWSSFGRTRDEELTCLAKASPEEDPILFTAELRELGMCRGWIGFEVEAVSGFPRRRD